MHGLHDVLPVFFFCTLYNLLKIFIEKLLLKIELSANVQTSLQTIIRRMLRSILERSLDVQKTIKTVFEHRRERP
jgi:hypothetical protein